MCDPSKSYQELIEENFLLKKRIQEFEISEMKRKRTEETLREAEMKYRSLTERMNDILWTADLEMNPTYASPSFEKVLGFKVEERIKQTIVEKVTPKTLRIVTEILEDELLHDAKRSPDRQIILDMEYYHKNGTIRYLESALSFIRNDIGKPVGIQGLSRDITESKIAEKALRESESNYRSIVDSANDAIFVHELKTGRILDVNTKMTEMYGYTREEALQIDVGCLSTGQPPYTQEYALEWIRKAVEEGPQLFEWKAKDKTGKVFWIETNLKLAKIGGNDRLLAIVRDITKRRLAEDIILDEKLKFFTYLENAPFGMILISQEGTINYINEKFIKIFGYEQEDIPDGRTWFRKAYPDAVYRHQVMSVWKDDLKKAQIGEQRSKVFSVTCKDDSTKTINFIPVMLMTGDNLMACEDITERKRAEEEKQNLEERLQRAEKMEALGLLAGGVAHDLNNVLGIVVGYAELLLIDIDEKNPMRNNLLNIMSGGERAAAIIQDMLTIARRGVSNRKVLNLNRHISDIKKLPEWEKLVTYHPNVQIKTNLESDLLNISGSSVHLEKTLFNLISNASEAMVKGGVVTIKTSNQYLNKPIHGYDNIHEGDFVVLSVSDEGEGINASDLKRIFEPFYTKKIMGRSGTGLGLSVVWTTVKDHNGYIDVQSEEEKGSIFTLYFPVSREEITEESAAVSMFEYMGKGESILIVDDVKGQRDLTTGMLKKLNYNVASVSSGEEAVEYLKEHLVDLLVLDMIMEPGMDGLDTYKSVLEIRPKQKAIIVSGFSETDRVDAAQALGAGAYVKKPYVIEKLGMAVKNELDRK